MKRRAGQLRSPQGLLPLPLRAALVTPEETLALEERIVAARERLRQFHGTGRGRPLCDTNCASVT